MIYTVDMVTADLLRAAAKIEERLAPVVGKGAGNIAQDARDAVFRSNQWPQTESTNDPQEFAARNLGFDAGDADDLDVTIGYDDDVTDLGRAVEFGGAHTPPGGQLGTALKREAPRFATMVGKVGAAVWRS